MLNKNDIAELIPFIVAFLVAVLLLLLAQPQKTVAHIPQSDTEYYNSIF
jgi:predicted Abi (CAAX) family protease